MQKNIEGKHPTEFTNLFSIQHVKSLSDFFLLLLN